MFDLIVRGAMIIDGTGGPAQELDVGVRDERITAVGRISEEAQAKHTVEAAGKALAPGFIDVHTHSDLHLLVDGRGESKVLQGVTTEVTGNCSFAPFPINPGRLDAHVDHLVRATARAEPTWTDLAGYAAALEANGLGMNVAPLAGHGTLRVHAMGLDQRRPSPEEMEQMSNELRLALDQGAWGMSTGLSHVPSAYGQFEEITELARILAEYDALYATHIRSGHGTEEAIEIGARSGVRVLHSHMALNHPRKWGTAAAKIRLLEEARERGVDITFDVYPYIASSSSLTQHLPDWVQAGGSDAMRARLARPQERARAHAEMRKGWFTGGDIPFLWERFLISATTDDRWVGRTIEQIAQESDQDPYETTLQLCEEYGNDVRIVLFYRDEQDVETFVAHPLSIIGSDGNAIPLDQGGKRPHPRSFGTFPRVLGHYARDRGALPLEDAVHKMSGEPARRLGLQDRGIIAEGKIADLVLFDPRKVGDTAGFTSAPTPPVGIDNVWVNGTLVSEDGALVSHDSPGRVLLRR